MYTHTCPLTNIEHRARVDAPLYVFLINIPTCIHTCIHTHKHKSNVVTCIHTHKHKSNVDTYIHAYQQRYKNTHILTRMQAYIFAIVPTHTNP